MMRKLKLEKRLNTRYQGVAAGVGSARILGRIENLPVTIGAGVEFNLYFLVIVSVLPRRTSARIIVFDDADTSFSPAFFISVRTLGREPRHDDSRD